MANPFTQLIAQPRSILDYRGQLEAIDASELRRRAGEFELGQAQRAATEQERERNALAALVQQAQGDQGRLAGLLEQSGSAGLMQRGAAMRKAALDAQESQVKIGEGQARAKKLESETIDQGLKRYRDALLQVSSPDQAAQWLMAQYNDPVVGQHAQKMGPLMQVAARIPQDPKGFEQWRLQQVMGMSDYQQMLSRQAAERREGANAIMTPGPDGTFVPNQPLIAAKKEIGASSATRLNVNTDNLGLKPKDRFEMEGKLADDYKAVTKLDNLVLSATAKIKTALAQPGAIKDQAAIYSFAKMLDPDGAVREADYAAISNTAGLLDRVKSYLQRLKTGEMLTDTQRQEMLGMMTAFEAVAQRRIQAAQSDFGDQAVRYNLRPESVFSGNRTGSAAPAPKPSAAPSNAPKPAGTPAPRVVDFSALPGG